LLSLQQAPQSEDKHPSCIPHCSTGEHWNPHGDMHDCPGLLQSQAGTLQEGYLQAYDQETEASWGHPSYILSQSRSVSGAPPGCLTSSTGSCSLGYQAVAALVGSYPKCRKATGETHVSALLPVVGSCRRRWCFT